MDYIHEQHHVHLIVYHIIRCPKRQRKVLVEPVAERLTQIIQEVEDKQHWHIVRLAIQPDHVHLLLRSNPTTTPYDIPRLVKGRSSRMLRAEFPHLLKLPTLWTRSSFFSTAGNISAETIEKYIERQSKS